MNPLRIVVQEIKKDSKIIVQEIEKIISIVSQESGLAVRSPHKRAAGARVARYMS